MKDSELFFTSCDMTLAIKGLTEEYIQENIDKKTNKIVMTLNEKISMNNEFDELISID